MTAAFIRVTNRDGDVSHLNVANIERVTHTEFEGKLWTQVWMSSGTVVDCQQTVEDVMSIIRECLR